MGDSTKRAEPEPPFRLIFEQAPAGVFLYDRELRVRECNARLLQILRTSHERLVGFDLRGLQERVVVPVLEAALEGRSATYEGPYEATLSPRRLHITLRTSPMRDARGNVVGAMGFLEDVTERKQAEEERGTTELALKRSESRFRQLIERAPDAIVVLAGGRVAYANPALSALLAYGSPEEMLGLRDYQTVHPEEYAELEARCAQVVAGGVPGPCEYRMRRKDGSYVHVEIVSMPIEYDGGPAVLAFARDLTERKMMQARLLLADRMVSVGTLAAGVAHEINNPLSYLMANLDMVLSRRLPVLAEGVRDAEQRLGLVGELSEQIVLVTEMLGIAREGADRVRNIVRDLKAFARGDDDRRGPVDVRRVLDAAINMAWNEIRHRAGLIKEYRSVPPIEANESRIGQVFLNILVNAAQAMPVGSAAENTIRVTAGADDAGNVIVEVSDTGPGIPKDVLGRIFDPFFTTKPVGVGTGLGLWICQGIISALNGTITVESEAGLGATFRVVLPSRNGALPVPTEVTKEVRAPAGPRGRVLVVDDEVAFGRTLAGVLGDEHDVVSTSSGRDALLLLRDDARFDAILCDLMMPNFTGMDLYETIVRERPALAPKFVFVTGGAFTPRARQFLEQVPARRIGKPFDIATLLTTLREVITEGR
jgi:PAS domain S-box-containing protein